MADLLTHDEYQTVATTLSLPVNPHIDGKFTKPQAGRSMDSLNPATGRLLAKVAACDAADVDFAVGKARGGVRSG